MDFKKVYAISYKNARNHLTEDQKAYLHGYARACHEISIFLHNPDVFDSIPESLPSLAKIESEIREKTIKELLKWTSDGWYQMIIELIDDVCAKNNENTENTGKLSSTIWKLPEPVLEEPSDNPAEIFNPPLNKEENK